MKKLLLVITLIVWAEIAVFSQPVIEVWNCKDSLKVLSQVQHCLNHFEIQEKIYLHVSYSMLIPDNMEGITYVLEAPDVDVNQTATVFKVRIDARLSEKKQRLILAHEMVHVKQFVKGELKKISQFQVLWKDKVYRFDHSHFPYTPWESEAYQKDRLLADHMKEAAPAFTPVITQARPQ